MQHAVEQKKKYIIQIISALNETSVELMLTAKSF